MILLHETCHSQGSIQMMGTKGAFGWGCATVNPTNSQVPFTLQKKLGRDPLKSGADQLSPWVTIRWGLWLKSAIVHMCKTAVKCGRLTWRRWHGTKMHYFTLHFRTVKGVWTHFLQFWSHSRLWPQNQKKPSPDLFHENMVWKVYTAKISGAYQLFYGSGPIFSSSVNGALSCLR